MVLSSVLYVLVSVYKQDGGRNSLSSYLESLKNLKWSRLVCCVLAFTGVHAFDAHLAHLLTVTVRSNAVNNSKSCFHLKGEPKGGAV